MSFRVTSSLQIDRSIFDIQQANGRLDQVQQQLSTGKRINVASDDPIGNARGMVLQNSISQNAQYLKNIDAATGFTDTTDSAMTSYTSSLQQLRQLAVEAANGTLDAPARAAISAQVTQIRAQIQQVGNTQYNGRYIFGGLKTDQQPYPTDVTLSPNDTGNLTTDIAPGVSTNFNLTGVSVFGDTTPPNTDNIYGVIDNFTTLLAQNTSTPDISQQTIAGIDQWLTTAGNQRTSMGGVIDRLQAGTTNLTAMNTNLSNLLQNTESTDIASASLQLNQGQATLTAALEVGAKAMPLTLVDFLK